MNPSALSRISSRICRAVVRPRKLLNLRSMANAGMSERVTQTNDLPKKDKILFTPGPLGINHETKLAMIRDLGSRDFEFMATIKEIRTKILDIAGISREEFTMVPMQGSGTFAIEAVIMTMVPKENGKLLVAYTGSYGKRMVEIAQYSNIETVVVKNDEDKFIDMKAIEEALKADPSITNVAVVHCETSSGVIHPIHEVGVIVRKYAPQATFFVDAMSSFGAVPVDMKNIDFLVTSANKCIEGTPGFGVVIARKSSLFECEGRCRSLSLDLYEQYKGLEANGQFRFTPPIHSILAFKKALECLEVEGGIEGRGRRYQENRRVLREGMKKLGFKEFLNDDHSGYIITSYRFPTDPNFDFKTFYSNLSEMGMAIYPGKVTEADCFRIGTIGYLHPQNIADLLVCIEKVCKNMNMALPVKY